MSNGRPDFDRLRSEAEERFEKLPGRRTLGEFKTFLIRGNVVDLAVAVAVGGAFTAVVQAFVADLITPLIAALGQQKDFSKLSFELNESTFNYGHFINVLIAFFTTAAVVFFFVVKPINHLLDRRKSETDSTQENKQCPECLSKIPAAARRCAFCTAVLVSHD